MKPIVWQLTGTLAVLGMLVGCGKFEASDKRKKSVNTDLNAGAAEEIVLDLTADYEQKPVDVVFLRGSNAAFTDQNQPFRARLSVATNQAVAFRELAVRLQNSGLDLQFGVVETTAANRATAEAGGGALAANTANAATPDYIMIPGGSFIELAAARMAQGAPQASLYPMTAIERLLARSKIDGPSKGMIRDDAILAIVALNFADEVDESRDWSSIKELLDKEKGAGNWRVSVLSPPKEGCAYNAVNAPTSRHTNMEHLPAALKPDPTKWAEYIRRNKTISLQEDSRGIFESICAESYIDFVNRFATDGMQAGFFEVVLKKPADASTIQVTVNGSPVEGWRYIPAVPAIMIPTSVKTGTKFSISYSTPHVAEGEVVDGPGGATDENGKIGSGSTNPAQLAFANSGAQAALNGCGAGCHNVTKRNYSSFATALLYGELIVERITATNDGANGTDMPPGPAMLTAAQIAAVQAWVGEFITNAD